MFRELNLFRGETNTAPNDNLWGGTACTALNDHSGQHSWGPTATDRPLITSEETDYTHFDLDSTKQRKSNSSEESDFHDAEESEQTFYDALDHWQEPDSVVTIATINVMDYSKAVRGPETKERKHKTQEEKDIEKVMKISMKEDYEQRMKTNA